MIGTLGEDEFCDAIMKMAKINEQRANESRGSPLGARSAKRVLHQGAEVVRVAGAKTGDTFQRRLCGGKEVIKALTEARRTSILKVGVRAVCVGRGGLEIHLRHVFLVSFHFTR